MKKVFKFLGLLEYKLFEYRKLNLGYYLLISDDMC